MTESLKIGTMSVAGFQSIETEIINGAVYGGPSDECYTVCGIWRGVPSAFIFNELGTDVFVISNKSLDMSGVAKPAKEKNALPEKKQTGLLFTLLELLPILLTNHAELERFLADTTCDHSFEFGSEQCLYSGFHQGKPIWIIRNGEEGPHVVVYSDQFPDSVVPEDCIWLVPDEAIAATKEDLVDDNYLGRSTTTIVAG